MSTTALDENGAYEVAAEEYRAATEQVFQAMRDALADVIAHRDYTKWERGEEDDE